MEVTLATWAVAITGLVLIGLLCALQLVAVLRPRARWTIENVYGGEPEATDPTAYFAFSQGFAWADVFLWLPIQVVGSIGSAERRAGAAELNSSAAQSFQARIAAFLCSGSSIA